MSAIPTRYAGIEFRSRLEARWAALFGLADISWEYETLDLDGYIPDFIISNGQVLVEVKPIVEWPCPVLGCVACGETNRTEYDNAVLKIQSSGWTGRAAIAGAGQLSDGAYARYIDGELMALASPAKAKTWWREAGNRVQWDGARTMSTTAKRKRSRVNQGAAYKPIADSKPAEGERQMDVDEIAAYFSSFERDD